MPDRTAGTWTVDPLHTAATFTVQYLTGPFHAEFERVDAQLVDGRLSGSVDVTSLNLKDQFFMQQIEGPEFLDVENHKQLTFSSNTIDVEGDDVVVEGELTIRGK